MEISETSKLEEETNNKTAVLWNSYIKKYNNLVEIFEINNLNPNLINELIDLHKQIYKEEYKSS
jgi:hypothetical protein